MSKGIMAVLAIAAIMIAAVPAIASTADADYQNASEFNWDAAKTNGILSYEDGNLLISLDGDTKEPST